MKSVLPVILFMPSLPILHPLMHKYFLRIYYIITKMVSPRECHWWQLSSPVFHTTYKSCGMENVTIFLLFSWRIGSVAKLYVSGQVPYVCEAIGELNLKVFTVEAIEHHVIDSKRNPATNQILSSSDIWIKHSLAINEELNLIFHSKVM